MAAKKLDILTPITAPEESAAALPDRRLCSLDADRYTSFVSALDNPPAPGPKFKALLKRVPAWEA